MMDLTNPFIPDFHFNTDFTNPMIQIADLQQEHQREMEGLLENVRQLSRELRLQMLVIDNFIPPEYQVCYVGHYHTCMQNPF